MPEIMVRLDSEELKMLGYPTLVKCYPRIMSSLSRRKKYHEKFNESERAKIAKFYRLFSKWHLQTGTPDFHSFSRDSLHLIEKALDWFARNY